jgi:hypothetical protein
MAAQFAETNNMAFTETSALDGANIELAFYRIINGYRFMVIGRDLSAAEQEIPC